MAYWNRGARLVAWLLCSVVAWRGCPYELWTLDELSQGAGYHPSTVTGHLPAYGERPGHISGLSSTEIVLHTPWPFGCNTSNHLVYPLHLCTHCTYVHRCNVTGCAKQHLAYKLSATNSAKTEWHILQPLNKEVWCHELVDDSNSNPCSSNNNHSRVRLYR